jgi:hypothetical protein
MRLRKQEESTAHIYTSKQTGKIEIYNKLSASKINIKSSYPKEVIPLQINYIKRFTLIHTNLYHNENNKELFYFTTGILRCKMINCSKQLRRNLIVKLE